MGRIAKIVVLLGLITHNIWACQKSDVQPDSTGNDEKREQRIGLLMEHSRNFEQFNTGLGLNLQLPVSNRVSFDYHFTMGWASDRSLYMHYPYMFGLGIRGINALNGHESSLANGMRFIMFLFCFIPEGVSYKINVSKTVQISPYLHPLGEDYHKDISTGKEITESVAEFGSRVVFKLNKKLYAMPHAGLKIYYNTNNIVTQGGITLGWRVNN